MRSDNDPQTLRQRIHHTLCSHMLAAEPPDHDRLRRVVAEPFTPRAITERIPRITAIADQLIDDVDPTRTVDLVAALGVPLPVRIITDDLWDPGVSFRRHQPFITCSRRRPVLRCRRTEQGRIRFQPADTNQPRQSQAAAPRRSAEHCIGAEASDPDRSKRCR
ncbi:hypothetical protein [Nocardia sp. NPDC058633]|uniref:hypothetical protein n=1 Tax=Nocardia sp. NPDC058633 TaxID=3346568 RepID=UPI003662F567